jgi:CheY-like chemotaxis protein
MDIDMPGMGGLACCRAFKADELLVDIPVVLVGAQDSPTYEVDARTAGAVDYLAKPLNRRQFLRIGHDFLVGIDRRETRRNYQIPVDFICRGQSAQGRCIDISSGGMFLDCRSDAATMERLLLRFSLPDKHLTPVEAHGVIAWVNHSDDLIKHDYP